MKTNTMLISTVVAGTLFIGIALYLSGRITKTAEPAIHETAPAAQPVQPGKKADKPTFIPPEETPINPSEESDTADPFSGKNELGIDETELAGIRQMIAEMLIDMDSTSSVEEGYYYRNSDDHSFKALSLRLALDQGATEKLNEILAAYQTRQTEQLIENQKAYAGNVQNMLKNDPEGYAKYLALMSMRSPDNTLTEEQEAYYEKYRQMIEPDEPSTAQSWYENSEIMSKLNEQLSPEQQQELTSYVQEKKVREQEINAYMRSYDLAEKLGLNEADRTTLYEYLHTNPNASDDEISELLTPELKNLLTPKQ